MDLFAKIFQRIKDVDCARLVEEQKLSVRQGENRTDVKALMGSSEKILQRMDVQQNQMLELNVQLKGQHEQGVEFQKEFLKRY